MSLTIRYQLVGTGWAKCHVSDGLASCELSASYLSNPLYNLLLAATAAIAGFSALTFRFDEEPGEFRWVIRSPRLNEIDVEVLEFDELLGDKPDSEGRSLFKTRCLPMTFAQAVYSAAKSVLTEYGENGYIEKWAEHPFPTLQFQELGRLITEIEGDG